MENNKLLANVSARSAPKLSINRQFFQIEFDAHIDFTGVMANGTRFDVNSFDAAFLANFNVTIKEEKLILHLIYLKPVITIPNDHGLSSLSITSMLEKGFMMALPHFNTFLETAIPMPDIHEIKFPNFLIILDNGFVRVATDIKYMNY